MIGSASVSRCHGFTVTQPPASGRRRISAATRTRPLGRAAKRRRWDVMLGLLEKLFDFLHVFTPGFVAVETGMDKADLAAAVDQEGRRHGLDVGGRDELLPGVANDGE